MISKLCKTWVILITFFLATVVPWADAAVEIKLEKTLQTEGIPLDVVISRDGNMTFVLTDKGEVLIYDRNGNLKDTITIGPHVAQIELDPSGERLFATSRQNKTVEIITIDFIHQINTQGSPYKGPQEAPVTIAVFTDFQ